MHVLYISKIYVLKEKCLLFLLIHILTFDSKQKNLICIKESSLVTEESSLATESAHRFKRFKLPYISTAWNLLLTVSFTILCRYFE